MSQQLANSEQTAQIDEHDAIARVLQLYMDGSARGEADKLKEAFHADSRMFGSMGGKRIDNRSRL